MIITHYDPKPIPLRIFDWQATLDGYDMGDPIGHGATEAEAIADLKAEIEFAAEAHNYTDAAK